MAYSSIITTTFIELGDNLYFKITESILTQEDNMCDQVVPFKYFQNGILTELSLW